MKQIRGRREFLQVTAMGAAACCGLGCATASGQASPAGKPRFELGLASYSLRKFDLAKTIEMTKRVGLKHIALKDMHLPLDSSVEQIRSAAAQVRQAGLDLYGVGVIYMKSADEVNRAFNYAKEAGVRVIIGVPQHDLLPLVDQKVKEYDIKVAIHNHGPGDKTYPCPPASTRRSRISTSGSACATTSGTRPARASMRRSPLSSSATDSTTCTSRTSRWPIPKAVASRWVAA